MDSLILGLEEHKSKSKPRPVTSITRIIHLREGRACGVWGEGGWGGAGRVRLSIIVSPPLHTHHLSSSVTPWVIYKCLIMRLFLPFSLSIHQAGYGGPRPFLDRARVSLTCIWTRPSTASWRDSFSLSLEHCCFWPLSCLQTCSHHVVLGGISTVKWG